MPDSLLNNTTFQGRLGRALDRLRRRTTDNNIRLAGTPIDALRISIKRDPQSQDIISRKIEDREVIPVIFPEMKDIPLRHFPVDLPTLMTSGDTSFSSSLKIPSIYPFASTSSYELVIPIACRPEVDDLIVRLIWDAQSVRPDIMCLQITEVLATISSYSNVTSQKVRCTFYNEELPSEVINWILLEYQKRIKINY